MPLRHLAVLMAVLLALTACSSEDGSFGETGELTDDAVSDVERPGSVPAAPSVQGATADAEVDDAEEVGEPVDAGVALTETLPPDPTQPEAASVNPWVSAAEDPLSTFGLDVDTISYSRARQAINDGYLPDPSAVRIEEVVNAFDFGYDVTADPEETFTITADAARWPWSADRDTRHLLRVAIATPRPEGRQPTDLVFVIDTSGSMTSLLPLVKDSLRILVNGLNGEDTVAIVEYSDDATPLLEPTPASDTDAILSVIDRLDTGGSTNLAGGLTTGYRLAERTNAPGRTGRVVILSDGIANVGATDPDSVLAQIEDAGDRGINLLTVGFGLGGFNDHLMEQLADRGDGFAAYIDTIDQAQELFGDRLVSTLEVLAVEARTQIEFRPAAVARYRLLGYENRDIADEDFRDDSIDAGEIGSGHSVTALYEIELAQGSTGPLAAVNLRWLDPESREAVEISETVDADEVVGDWESAPAGLRLAGTVAAWAELLRQSPHAAPDGLSGLVGEASRLAGAINDDRVTEWAGLVARSAEL